MKPVSDLLSGGMLRQEKPSDDSGWDGQLANMATHFGIEHVGIIMDGNGRWAQAGGKSRAHGHKAGVDSLRQIVEAAGDAGVKVLTVYAFSTENWKRPQAEVAGLFALLKAYVASDLDRLDKAGVQIRVIGRRTGLEKDIIKLINLAETRTAKNQKMVLSIGFNYGARAEIVDACQSLARQVAAGTLSPDDIDEKAFSGALYTKEWPDPDLIVRTGGDLRLSNFLLWQSAYAELVSVDVYWPDFNPQAFKEALEEFLRRTRRFGGL